MQTILVNVLGLGLMLFVFARISRARQDDRFRCWTVAGICVLAHCAAEFTQPATLLGRQLQSFALSSTLALAGISFLVSTMILVRGRKAALRLATISLGATLPLLGLADFGCTQVAILCAGVLAHLLVMTASIARMRHRRRRIDVWVVCAVFAGTAAWSIYGILHGMPTLIMPAMLAGLFLASAIEFVGNCWEPTAGLYTMGAGLAAWAIGFPAGMWIHTAAPQLSLAGALWSLPAFCVAMGMILLVFEEDARTSRRLSEDYRLIFDHGSHAMWILDPNTLRFMAVNEAALALHGYTREEFLNLRPSDILDPSCVAEAERLATLPHPAPKRALRHVRKDGSTVPLDVVEHNILFRGKECRLVLGVDVSERDELERELARQAHRDTLTGLPNRLLFEEQLGDAVRRNLKAGEKLAILCLDVCRFKHINDVYGPRVGDECLRQVARLLSAHLRPGEILARTGGDEFAFVLGGLRNAAAILEQTAADVRRIFQHPMMVKGNPIRISFSMGLAICPEDGTDAVTLWRGAESVLRRAQAEGGGKSVWLSPELREEAEQQIEIESTMRKKMENAGFHLHYQPIYGFEGKVSSLEALIRLDHADYGPVSPSKMIPIAEETGLILPLGLWVVEQVCQQLRSWLDQGLAIVPVAVNVSALQLKHGDFAQHVMEALRKHDIVPEWIHLEVTETAAMRELKDVSGQMAMLAEAGISFSIDDFGTGHSSLGRLHQLPISVLKIDRSFIEQLCCPNESYTTLTIVQAIVSMAHALGQRVIAEGVETPAQLACLRGLHCDLLQGFLLSEPVPPELIPSLLPAAHPIFDQLSELESYVPPLRASRFASRVH